MAGPLELKKTLNLPKTDFSMKANLPQNEPKCLEKWEKMGIYAQKYLDMQREQFKRLGIFGRWDRPYSTMDPQYESVIVRLLFDFMEQGAVYKGLRPVYWCIHDKTALAEAEVEYAMHTSPSVWVKYRLTSDPAKIDSTLAG